VTSAAPRYDPRLIEAAAVLDDPDQPIAETCRRVGTFAEKLGLPRPSYVHLRRLILAERERKRTAAARREEIRQILGEAYFDLMRSRRVDAYELADRLANAGSKPPRRARGSEPQGDLG